MANHVLSIDFEGNFSRLRTQLEQEQKSAQDKLGRVDVGGGSAATTSGPPGTSPQAQQAVGSAFDQAEQRRLMGTSYIPPVQPGMARFYSGGAAGGGGPRWFSPDFAYAQGYASKSTGGVVSYLDLPKSHPIITKAFDDTGTSVTAPYNSFEAPALLAAQRRVIGQQGRSSSEAALDRAERRRTTRSAVDERELSPIQIGARNESTNALDRTEIRRASNGDDGPSAAQARSESRAYAQLQDFRRRERRGFYDRNRTEIEDVPDEPTGPQPGGEGLRITPGSRPGTRGARGFFSGGLRAGRLGQYLTAGFAVLEASRVARAFEERDTALALAGPNLRGQLAAEQKFQQSIEGVPLLGPLVGFAADKLGASRRGTALIEQSANQTDARTAALAENKLRLAGITSAANIAGAANEFDKARATAEFQSTVSAGETQRRRQAEGDATNEAIANERARLDPTFQKRLHERVLKLHPGEFGNVDAQNDFFRITGDALREADAAGLAQTRKQRNDASNDQARAENEGNDRLKRVTLENVGRAERASNKRLTGEAISLEYLANDNDTFGSQLAALDTERAAKLVESENDPIRSRLIQRAEDARVNAFKAQTRRELLFGANDANASSEQARALLRGDPLVASQIGTNAQRDRALRVLPDNAIFNALGGSALRKAINEQADTEIQFNTRNISSQLQSQYDEYSTAADVARLNSENKPLTARAAAIGESAQAKARVLARAGGFWNMQNRKLLLQTAQYQETSLINDIAYGGGVQVVAPGSTGNRFAFDNDPGNSDATEAAKRSAEESEKMRILMQNSILFDPMLAAGY